MSLTLVNRDVYASLYAALIFLGINFWNHESERSPGDGDGWGGLACCDSWGRKESDTTEQLN